MIIDLQRRLAEVGRIRIGQQVPIGSTGKSRPAKLTTFRLTSPDQQRIAHAAQLYGGTAEEWEAPAGAQWQVVTEVDRLAVMVPPSDLAFTQYYELWSGGGCQRRCDGRVESISDGDCLCDPDKRQCDIHTRLSVMLRDLVGLGLWRLDTQGWNAALELQGAVEVMQLAAGRGQMLPAQLRLEQRMVKRPNQQTRRFAVPVLDIEISPAQLLHNNTPLEPRELVAEAPPINGAARLTPVPDSVPEWPTASISQQAEPPTVKPKRRGSQQMPATNLAPRTAAQAAASTLVAEDMTPDAPPIDDGPPVDMTGVELGDRDPPPRDDYVDNVIGVTLDDGVRMINSAQLTKLSILLKEAGFGDREARHAFVAAAIGRDIDSAKNLTLDEASKVIDILENKQEPRQ